MLNTVASDADRLSRLIADLLDVARIDTGRLQMHTRPCDVVVLSERVVASVQHATATRITLDVHEVPMVAADPDKVTQVVTNLVENAVRHGAGDVAVTIEPDPADPAYVAITVVDEGEGIPEELRQRVFTKFWTASSGGGSGLGLYIVNGLVRAHGGTVTIADRTGGGASIRVTWPVHRDRASLLVRRLLRDVSDSIWLRWRRSTCAQHGSAPPPSRSAGNAARDGAGRGPTP